MKMFMNESLSAFCLHPLQIEPFLRATLLEDWGRAGDITSQSVILEETSFRGTLTTRQAGTLAGISVAAQVFSLCDPKIQTILRRRDGETFQAGESVMEIEGPARSVLSGERVALNLVCHLSGIATATASLVAAARPHGAARITCTRKTTPGLRALEKAAVRAGGGFNHRFGLDDAILIKDNHIVAAGSIAVAVHRARAAIGHLVCIEVEIDHPNQLDEALASGIDAILLDNMDLATLAESVRRVHDWNCKMGSKVTTEASGRVTVERVGAIAATGVDVISAGWLTHSAPILDIGLDALSSARP
jgi:nicotinate-nucleotide pyrophosphorylase (carboxylating)